MGAGERDCVFIVSGKLEPRKRPADALKAFASLPGTNRPARLWFLGSGPLDESLRRRASDLGVEGRVAFLGFRNQSEMPAILQAADALIHASERDPWPYSVLDAAISGLALVLSDRTGSYPDWSPEPTAARVFRCGDLAGLSAAIEELVESPDATRALGESARAKADRHRESVFCDIFEGRLNRRMPIAVVSSPPERS
jgi:glycosyltransferase involved in cell wall biosynthesis